MAENALNNLDGVQLTATVSEFSVPSDLEASVKVPYVIKNKILMSSGIWNNYYYSGEQIKKAFLNTDWSSKDIRSLFLDHDDRKSREWIGEVINVKLTGNNTVVGDLVVVDKSTAMKLAYGAKMGISPKVHGSEDDGKMLNFLFDNLSVVINPAVKTAYINNQENVLEETKMAEQENPVNTVVENKAEAPVVEEKKPEVMAEVPKEMPTEEIPKEEKYPQPEEQVMASADMLDQIIKMATKLKEEYAKVSTNAVKEEVPKEEYPAPKMAEEEMKKKVAEEVAKCMQEIVSKKDESIKELSQEISKLNEKLNEPAQKETVVVSEMASVQKFENVDAGMLNALKSMRGY